MYDETIYQYPEQIPNEFYRDKAIEYINRGIFVPVAGNDVYKITITKIECAIIADRVYTNIIRGEELDVTPPTE